MKKIFNFSNSFGCKALFLVICSLGSSSYSADESNVTSGLQEEKDYGPGKACCWFQDTSYCATWNDCDDQGGKFYPEDEDCC